MYEVAKGSAAIRLYIVVPSLLDWQSHWDLTYITRLWSRSWKETQWSSPYSPFDDSVHTMIDRRRPHLSPICFHRRKNRQKRPFGRSDITPRKAGKATCRLSKGEVMSLGQWRMNGYRKWGA